MKLNEAARRAAMEYNHYRSPDHRGMGRPQMDVALDKFKVATGLTGMSAHIALCVLGRRNAAQLFPVGHELTASQKQLVAEVSTWIAKE